jgi:hypothetical protein
MGQLKAAICSQPTRNKISLPPFSLLKPQRDATGQGKSQGNRKGNRKGIAKGIDYAKAVRTLTCGRRTVAAGPDDARCWSPQPGVISLVALTQDSFELTHSLIRSFPSPPEFIIGPGFPDPLARTGFSGNPGRSSSTGSNLYSWIPACAGMSGVLGRGCEIYSARPPRKRYSLFSVRPRESGDPGRSSSTGPNLYSWIPACAGMSVAEIEESKQMAAGSPLSRERADNELIEAKSINCPGRDEPGHDDRWVEASRTCWD